MAVTLTSQEMQTEEHSTGYVATLGQPSICTCQDLNVTKIEEESAHSIESEEITEISFLHDKLIRGTHGNRCCL